MLSSIPFLNKVMSKTDAFMLNPLVLAFVGDSVQTLYVRTELAYNLPTKAGILHKYTSEVINASSQAVELDKIYDRLTEEEVSVFKRARNSKVGSIAKNASCGEYKKASGYEAIIGYLYLSGQYDRLNELLDFNVDKFKETLNK